MQPVFLSEFRRSSLLQSFSQVDLNIAYVKFLSIAACLLKKVQSKEKANQILLDCKQKMESYGVKPHYIAKRKIAILPGNYFNKKTNDLQLPAIYENLYQQPLGAGVLKRTNHHSKISFKILEEWFANEKELNDEIKFVTSSAYESPNVLQKFISDRQLNLQSCSNCFNCAY